MAQTPQEAARMPILVEDARTTSYATASSLALLVFDYFCTVQDEVDLFWRAPWTLPKALYIWNRYFAFLVVGLNLGVDLTVFESASVCSLVLRLQSLTCAIIAADVDAVLLLRVWILYERSQKLLYILLPMFCVEVVSLVFIAIYWDSPKFLHVEFMPTGCYATPIIKHYTIFVIPPLIVSSTMFTLTTYRCTKTLRASAGVKLPLFRLLLRDGILYFLISAPVAIAGLLMWQLARPTLGETTVGLSCALYSIIASRISINLRQTTTEDACLQAQGSTVSLAIRNVTDERCHQTAEC